MKSAVTVPAWPRSGPKGALHYQACVNVRLSLSPSTPADKSSHGTSYIASVSPIQDIQPLSQAVGN